MALFFFLIILKFDLDFILLCCQDNCPLVHNPDQDLRACVVPAGFTGCRAERGRRLGIAWGNTPRGETAIQKCPDSQGEERWDNILIKGGLMLYLET